MEDVKERDAFDDATNAELPANEYYGQLAVDAWNCVLVKGTGKVPFDAAQHQPNKRLTAVDIALTPLSDMNLQFSIERGLIAQFPAWVKVTWASAQKCGCNHARDLNNSWVRCKLSPTGRTWMKDGEKKEETTLEFIEFYKDEDACRAAYLGTKGDTASTEQAPAEDTARKTALAFAKVVINNAAAKTSDVIECAALFNKQSEEMPVLGGLLSSDPEVMALIVEAVNG